MQLFIDSVIFCLFSVTPCCFRTYFVVCFFVISSSVLEQAVFSKVGLEGGISSNPAGTC